MQFRFIAGMNRHSKLICYFRCHFCAALPKILHLSMLMGRYIEIHSVKTGYGYGAQIKKTSKIYIIMIISSIYSCRTDSMTSFRCYVVQVLFHVWHLYVVRVYEPPTLFVSITSAADIGIPHVPSKYTSIQIERLSWRSLHIFQRNSEKQASILLQQV